ncbi:hypothetical protein PYW07_001324 [Mythimna separata]|uniref:C-type lectin domain-containing protein n=1 Tax=Mythimna separata TaxID=271217 RepID=A0AAD8DVR6_MYTSE|nr:hypothetical protein PYW07_001324 [Mythimna separata]
MLKLFGLTFIFVTVNVVVCKQDYHYNKRVDAWLKLHAVPASWNEAFLSCHYEGAVLASPINLEFATALRGLMVQSQLDGPIFLGVHSLTKKYFSSIEGVPLTDLSITWGSYGDGRTPENCLTLSTGGKTYISSCQSWHPYICYKRNEQYTMNFNQCGTFDDDYILNGTLRKCYKFHKKPRSWYKAYDICSAEGGHLVIINNEEEANYITSYLVKPTSAGNWGERVHIGIRDWIGDQTWLTIHGEKLESVYHSWAEGQPNVSEHLKCGVIWTRGYLDDLDCNQELRFFCEKDPNTSHFRDSDTYYDTSL